MEKSYTGINQSHIEMFAERLIRKQLLLQTVNSTHPVLLTENKLVQEADDLLREEIQNLHMSGESIHLVEMNTIIRIRNAIRIIVQFHEIDADSAESAVFGANKEAYSRISKSRIRNEFIDARTF